MCYEATKYFVHNFCLNYFLALHIMKICHNNEKNFNCTYVSKILANFCVKFENRQFHFLKRKYFDFFSAFKTIFCLFSVSVEFCGTSGNYRS